MPESNSGAEMLVVEVADAGFFEVGDNTVGVDANIAPGDDLEGIALAVLHGGER